MNLDLLLFSFNNAWFGIDIEQLAAITPYRDDEDDDLVSLERIFGGQPRSYREPRVISVKGDGAGKMPPYRLLIEAPEDIRNVDWRDVRPLPSLLEPFIRRLGVWGVLPLDERLILLLDCHRIDHRLRRKE